ncbi:MAG: hypothetical protein VXV96_17665 [Bdellovibrionota bacterium]|nr:hypothetical protein [Bdellovibrionota bacterium]
MKIYKEGDKSKGICKSCNSLVSTTFKTATVELSSGKGTVDNILAGVCDDCDHVVSVPHQSMPKIKETISAKKKSIEARMPRHLLDVLSLASDQFELGSSDTLVPSLVRYYIGIADDKERIKEIRKLSESEFAKGKLSEGNRLSFKMNEPLYKKFEELRKKTNLTKTKLLKGLILQINEEILQKPKKKKLEEVEKVMLASG